MISISLNVLNVGFLFFLKVYVVICQIKGKNSNNFLTKINQKNLAEQAIKIIVQYPDKINSVNTKNSQPKILFMCEYVKSCLVEFKSMHKIFQKKMCLFPSTATHPSPRSMQNIFKVMDLVWIWAENRERMYIPR